LIKLLKKRKNCLSDRMVWAQWIYPKDSTKIQQLRRRLMLNSEETIATFHAKSAATPRGRQLSRCKIGRKRSRRAPAVAAGAGSPKMKANGMTGARRLLAGASDFDPGTS